MIKKPTIGKYYDADEQALIESIESDDAQFESVLNDERIKERFAKLLVQQLMMIVKKSLCEFRKVTLCA